MKLKILFLALFCLAEWNASVLADERIWIESTINDKPARLAWDSGANASVLFKGAPEKFGLKVNDRQNGYVKERKVRPVGITEACKVGFSGATVEGKFAVFEFPSYMGGTMRLMG